MTDAFPPYPQSREKVEAAARVFGLIRAVENRTIAHRCHQSTIPPDQCQIGTCKAWNLRIGHLQDTIIRTCTAS